MSDLKFSIGEADVMQDLPTLSKALGKNWKLDRMTSPKGFELMSALYAVEGFAGSNWIRIARVDGKAVGFAGLLIPHIGFGSWYQVSTNLVEFFKTKLEGFEEGKKILEIHAELVKINSAFSKESFPDFPDSPVTISELQLFYVAPAYQGRGIGTALLQEAIQASKDRGMKRLIVVSDSDSNWRYYLHRGWKQLNEKLWPCGHHNYAFDLIL